MNQQKEFYMLCIYSPIDEDTYRKNRRIFNTHQEGMKWAIDNYGWTDALFSGEYVSEHEANVLSDDRVSIKKKSEVTDVIHPVSDLQALVLEIKEKAKKGESNEEGI